MCHIVQEKRYFDRKESCLPAMAVTVALEPMRITR